MTYQAYLNGIYGCLTVFKRNPIPNLTTFQQQLKPMAGRGLHTIRSLQSNIYPTRCNFTQFIYIWKLLYMFRMIPPPIIRSAYNCIYSIWY